MSNKYLNNLKKNYFYALMVGMIISLPMLMVIDTLADEEGCHEEDYSGDVTDCVEIAKNAQTHGWVLMIFPFTMAIGAGMFHFFPTEEKPKEEVKEVKGGISVGTIMAFLFAGISVMFITVASGVLSDEHYETYKYVILSIPPIIFIIAYRNFNGRWFWEEKKGGSI